MATWTVKPISVKVWTITAVSPMTDDGGFDLSIDFDGKPQQRHAGPEVLRFVQPQEGDYWVEYETVAMPWAKAEFEKRHLKQEGS